MASGGDQPFLPFDIIINILKRLPVKSICRFQCVCKEWKNLFKTPSFMAEHLDHSDRKNPFLLLHEYCYECRGFIDNNEYWRSSLRLLDHKMETVEVLSIPSIGSFRRRWEIIGSCNGVLCVEVYHGPGRSPSLWLWNPVIREVREVPNTPNDGRLCTVGFGFSSVVNDYKIVRFYSQNLPNNEVDRLYYHSGIVGVEVYSLSTGSWKELEFGVLHISAALSKAVNVDGTIFWLYNIMVVSFDIATEVVTLTQVPTEDGFYPIGLGVYKNKLVGHYGFREEGGPRSVYVWVMEEVASESGKSLIFTQKYRIDQGSHVSHPLCFWRNEMVCLAKKYITGEENDPKYDLRMFNLNTNEEREFNCSTFCTWCDVFNYKKSLVSVWNNQVE